MHRLFIFDLDGTLAPFDGDTLYADAAAWISKNPYNWMVATNQGGIGLRYWMEKDGFGNPDAYPTLESFQVRIQKLFPSIPADELKMTVLMCAAYQSKKTQAWGPIPPSGVGYAMWNIEWRKPSPGMLRHAMLLRACFPPETLMVGDGPEDELAAKAAGCDFQWAWQFFGRSPA